MDSQDLKLVSNMIHLLSGEKESSEQLAELEQLLDKLTEEGNPVTSEQSKELVSPDDPFASQHQTQEPLTKPTETTNSQPVPNDPFASEGTSSTQTNTQQDQVLFEPKTEDPFQSQQPKTLAPAEKPKEIKPLVLEPQQVPTKEPEKLKELETEVELLKAEVKAQKDKISKLETQKEQYKEEAESHLLTSQMTITHMLAELDAAMSEEDFHKQYSGIIEGITSTRFNASNLITKKYPGSLLFNRKKGIGDNNILFVKEKYGLTYIIVVHHVVGKIQSSVISMFSKLLLESVVAERRGISAANLLENFETPFQDVLKQTQVQNTEYKISCCVLDEERMEIEFSSNGLPIFLKEDNVLNEYSVEQGKTVGGKYAIRSLMLKKDSTLFIPSYNSLPSGFEKYLQEISKINNNQQQDEKLSAFLESDSSFSEDFMLVGIKL